jgi:aryl-alcohol dehydrogenase-like predicted oxidoreductase
VLSGKFTRPGGTTDVTRVSANSISTHDHTVAQAVQDLADQLGATASQVALAWTMTRSTAVHPIVGVRRLDQLLDNLGALDLSLTPQAVEQLEATTAFDIGFPNDFIRDMQSFVYGDVGARVDDRQRTTR